MYYNKFPFGIIGGFKLNSSFVAAEWLYRAGRQDDIVVRMRLYPTGEVCLSTFLFCLSAFLRFPENRQAVYLDNRIRIIPAGATRQVTPRSAFRGGERTNW